MEKLQYIIEDKTIAELLGVQNFSTDESAVLELVKNAYDAHASFVKLILKIAGSLFLTTAPAWTLMILNKSGCMLGKAQRTTLLR